MSAAAPPPWYSRILTGLIEGQDLTPVQMCALMHSMLNGDLGELETACLLVALSMKGESGEELAAAAAVVREHAIHLVTGRSDLLDTCGTGGDRSGTFNISTAAALVAAGAGVPVVKHGNRAMSSCSGSADVLAALGVIVECDPPTARACLDRTGMAFCLAPRFHPYLQRVGAVRRRLGVRTLFNCLGPLANPAGAPYQLLGVGRPEWLDSMAAALARLGTRHTLLVCGADGLDEVTLAGPTLVREVRGEEVRELEWTPEDFGLDHCNLDEVRAAGPDESAAIIRQVLSGAEGPATQLVLANAAAALLAAERVTSPSQGVACAREAVCAGKAARVLHDLVALTRAQANS
jgi:anthranilate phosphoribosyltransferase